MRRLKSLFLILVALWLPVQAAGAATMPWLYVQEHGAPDVERCHLHDEATTVEATVETAGDCENCRICHLASAGFLLTAHVPQTVAAGSVLVALPTAAMPSHIGDPPQQPPRR